MPTLRGIAKMAGVPTNGMTVNAYRASRFSPLPATDAAVPDGLPADVSGLASANDPLHGGDGAWSASVGDYEPYYFTAVGSDGHVYWLDAVVASNDTTQQDYSASVDQILNRTMEAALVASGSNGVVLPASSLSVNAVSGAGFPSSGIVMIQIGAAFTFVAYTSATFVSGSLWTLGGCSGGSGTLSTNNPVWLAYQNGTRRRNVRAVINCSVGANNDQALAVPYRTAAGVMSKLGGVGIAGWHQAVTFVLGALVSFDVDPNGYYVIAPSVLGGGSLTVVSWIEQDN